jgi:hypothetical protein
MRSCPGLTVRISFCMPQSFGAAASQVKVQQSPCGPYQVVCEISSGRP